MDKENRLKNIGENIRLARRSTNLSQSELADKCGVNRATIIRIEKGTAEARPALLIAISQTLNLDVSQLSDNSNSNSISELKAMDAFELGQGELIKSMLSFIPGGQVFDSVMNFRSNLKIKRTIEFSASVKVGLEQILDRELHSKDFEKEDIIDVMESVMNIVHRTKSKYKLERFRNIIIKQFVEPARDYEVHSYLKLVEEMNDIELIMLDMVSTSNPRIQKGHFPINLAWYNRKAPIIDEGQQYKVYVRVGDLDAEITDSQVDFLENNLLSKGLMMRTMGKTKDTLQKNEGLSLEYLSKEVEKYREDNFEEKYFALTQFGESFLNYINTPT